jgi:hypothetical protein
MDTNRQTHLRYTVAILSRGDADARRDATPQNSRFVRVFEELAASGIEALPVIYDETFADAVRDQLLALDGVLVWVDPIHQGKTRTEPAQGSLPHRRQQAYAGGHHHVCNNRARLLRRDPAKRVVSAYGVKRTRRAR